MHTYFKTAWMTVLLFFLVTGVTHAQLEIHQINVGNGDGALIKLYDDNELIYTIVIDGGLKATDNKFIPYLKNFIPDIPGKPGKKLINWVILSHNHQDHFKGLIEMFNDDAFIIKKITDQFGYKIGEDTYTSPLPVAENNNCEPFIARSISGKNPQQALVEYVQAVKAANTRKLAYDNEAIRADTAFYCATKKFMVYTLPEVDGVPVTMQCIAADGFTEGVTTRDVGGRNANNFTYGWVLEFGQFRFYTGGDLGGYNGGYTDQETPMAAYLTTLFPNNHPETGVNTATNFPGHVCVMKTNHHGSTQSSNPNFLKTLACSSIVTSAGKHDRWKIPTVDFVDRVAAIPAFGAIRGVYFTQIYNYGTENARTEANLKFDGKADYNYVTPGDGDAAQYSFLFTVYSRTVYTAPGKKKRTIKIEDESVYTVSKVRTSDFNIAQQFVCLCHKP